MPIPNTIDTLLLPAQGRFRGIVTTLAGQIDNQVEVEAVKYFEIPPEVEETYNKVVYIELQFSDLLIESIMSTQRSLSPIRITISGFIRDTDPLTGLDFLEELMNAVLSSTSVSADYNAFGTNLGFSIENIEGIAWDHGTDLGTQVRFTLIITTDFPQIT